MNKISLTKQKTAYNKLITLMFIGWLSSLIVASKTLTQGIDIHTFIIINFVTFFSVFVLKCAVGLIDNALAFLGSSDGTIKDWLDRSIYNNASSLMFFHDINRQIITGIAVSLWVIMGVLAWRAGIYNPEYNSAIEYVMANTVYVVACFIGILGLSLILLSSLIAILISRDRKTHES